MQKYAKKDKRFVIINQENSGQGVARNNALKMAKGKYILFVDSENNNKIANTSDKSSALKENKDKLPNYEVVFEKTNMGYTFKEIKKVS